MHIGLEFCVLVQQLIKLSNTVYKLHFLCTVNSYLRLNELKYSSSPCIFQSQNVIFLCVTLSYH